MGTGMGTGMAMPAETVTLHDTATGSEMALAMATLAATGTEMATLAVMAMGTGTAIPTT
jgi:hypothetical protein